MCKRFVFVVPALLSIASCWGIDEQDAIRQSANLAAKLKLVPQMAPFVTAHSEGGWLIGFGNIQVGLNEQGDVVLLTIDRGKQNLNLSEAQILADAKQKLADLWPNSPYRASGVRQASGDNGQGLRVLSFESASTPYAGSAKVLLNYSSQGEFLGFTSYKRAAQTRGTTDAKLSVEQARQRAAEFLNAAIDNRPDQASYFKQRQNNLQTVEPALEWVVPSASKDQASGFGIDGRKNLNEERLSYVFHQSDASFSCQYAIDAETGELNSAVAGLLKSGRTVPAKPAERTGPELQILNLRNVSPWIASLSVLAIVGWRWRKSA